MNNTSIPLYHSTPIRQPIPEYGLQPGYTLVFIDTVPGPGDLGEGYIFEVLDPEGTWLDVAIVPKSAVIALQDNQLLG